jgi:hypothetical protein
MVEPVIIYNFPSGTPDRKALLGIHKRRESNIKTNVKKIGSGAQPAFCTMGTEGFFPWK